MLAQIEARFRSRVLHTTDPDASALSHAASEYPRNPYVERGTMDTTGFSHVSTGGGCTALVRRFAPKFTNDAGAIALTADDEDPQAPTNLDAPCVVGLYRPDAFFDGGGSFLLRTAPSLREALGWGREQTSLHEAEARLPAHWE